VMWNANVELLLGYSKEELPQVNIAEFIDEPYREATLKVFTDILENNEVRTIEYRLITTGGLRKPYIGSGQRVTINGQYFIVGQAVNIEKLKKTEDSLKHKLEEISALKTELEKENSYLRKKVDSNHDYKELIGVSNDFKHAITQVQQASKNDLTVLIQGDSGTGKSLYAQTIHNYGNFKNEAFIRVNCGSLTEAHHVADVCTSAKKGTLFLENINELSLEVQATLVHFLKELKSKHFINQESNSIRVISSTQQDLEEMVGKGEFRKDLFFYFNNFLIKLPPLKERASDIPILTQHFVDVFNQKHGKNVGLVTINLMNKLQQYTWPGNVRELENVIERAVVISPAKKLIIESFSLLDFDEKRKVQSLSEVERNHIEKTLKFTNGRIDGKKGAALILDINPETLRSRMRKLGINRVCT